MAALLGDEAEAIPLGLEDPRFIVEGGVDECREHRSISGIHAFSFGPGLSIWDQPLLRPWCQCHHKTAPTPTTATAIGTTSRAEFSIQAIAGIPSAMIRPRRQTCHESTCTRGEGVERQEDENRPSKLCIDSSNEIRLISGPPVPHTLRRGTFGTELPRGGGSLRRGPDGLRRGVDRRFALTRRGSPNFSCRGV